MLSLLNKGTDTRIEIKEMLRINYQSRNLIGPYQFGGMSTRNLFPDHFSLGGAHGLGTRLCPHHTLALMYQEYQNDFILG